MPGWKGLSCFYVWSWLQPATGAAENGAPLPSGERGVAGSWLLVLLVLPSQGSSWSLRRPQGCHLSAGARDGGSEGLSVQVRPPASLGTWLMLWLTGACVEVKGVECVR